MIKQELLRIEGTYKISKPDAIDVYCKRKEKCDSPPDLTIDYDKVISYKMKEERFAITRFCQMPINKERIEMALSSWEPKHGNIRNDWDDDFEHLINHPNFSMALFRTAFKYEAPVK